ncbi:MAG: KH domain-containing protein [Candidatus Heimdallarchaeaceae archaeon]
MSSEFLIRIPLERIAVLIGPKGSTKKKIEELTQCKVLVDSKSGDVIVVVEGELEDPVSLWKARDMIKAIGRGFSPEKAFRINEASFAFDLIQLRDFTGTSPNALREIRSRIIGRKGRTRSTIEQITGSYISVYGNTVGIIGESRTLQIVREGLIRLINGAKHSTVYRYLEQKLRALKEDKDKLWIDSEKEEDLATLTDLDELERIVFEDIENEYK